MIVSDLQFDLWLVLPTNIYLYFLTDVGMSYQIIRNYNKKNNQYKESNSNHCFLTEFIVDDGSKYVCHSAWFYSSWHDNWYHNKIGMITDAMFGKGSVYVTVSAQLKCDQYASLICFIGLNVKLKPDLWDCNLSFVSGLKIDGRLWKKKNTTKWLNTYDSNKWWHQCFQRYFWTTCTFLHYAMYV